MASPSEQRPSYKSYDQLVTFEGALDNPTG